MFAVEKYEESIFELMKMYTTRIETSPFKGRKP